MVSDNSVELRTFGFVLVSSALLTISRRTKGQDQELISDDLAEKLNLLLRAAKNKRMTQKSGQMSTG